MNENLDSMRYDADDEWGSSWGDQIKESFTDEEDFLIDEESGPASENGDTSEDLNTDASVCSWDNYPAANDFCWPKQDDATNAWECNPSVWADLFEPQVQEDWELENGKVYEEKEPAFKAIIVDTAEKFGEFLPILSQLREGVPELGCDCEGGKDFGRHGVMTFFSLTVRSLKKTYILDVWQLLKLEIKVFEQENEDGLSLKKVLGSEKYLQLWFDVRSDWDTLYHKFGVTPGRILDLQLLEFISRIGQRESIFGLYRVMREHGSAFMSPEEHEAWLDEKDEGRKYFNDHELKYGVPEEERPISETTRRYIAGDTDCMFSLYDHLEKILRIWEKTMQIPKPKKAFELADISADLSKPESEQPVEYSYSIPGPQVAETAEPTVSVPQPKTPVPERQAIEALETTVPVESSMEEDWMTFIEKQSILRARLAMAPDYNSNDIEARYRAPAAFIAICKLEYNTAYARWAKEIENGPFISSGIRRGYHTRGY
ncbi:hypothetical protein DSL72_000422 [Monilinia vaccinii-corymbosi]|uniref:3'-5' exonuclease domain-containing protein n=1 Tax=Monilinia vaccinii-corymbosi TaxID=61207 RepID=A0A8A3P491_9HELO|nr:hypothetical protein DSL72_000422 [Monilinia vaccinii-corymbosi]